MQAQTEGLRPGEFLISQLPGDLSIDNIVIPSGAGTFPVGRILGKITHAGGTSAAKSGGNTGNGTMSAITVGVGALPGVYRLRMTAATHFRVENPDGIEIGEGDTGAAFSQDGVGFTLTAGGTAFVAGDGFDITIAAGSGKYDNYDADATNGTDRVAGVLFGPVDATSADQAAVLVNRDAEVFEAMLSTEDSGDLAGAKTALLALGFKLRAKL